MIVSDDRSADGPAEGGALAAADPSRHYVATVLSCQRAAEIPWDDTALIVWHAPIPKADDVLAQQLRDHVAAGRALLFLPPETPDDAEFSGCTGAVGRAQPADKPRHVEWWRNDAGSAREYARWHGAARRHVEVIAALRDRGRRRAAGADWRAHEPLLVRSAETQGGSVYFLGTLPGPGVSSLARDGVALFAMLHRALNDGARTLGKAQQRIAAANALGDDPGEWHPVRAEGEATPVLQRDLPLRAGVVESRRPAHGAESAGQRGSAGSARRADAWMNLFAGLDYPAC